MKLTKEQKIDLLKGTSPEELMELLKGAEINLPELNTETQDKKVAELEAQVAELTKTQITEEQKAQLTKVEELQKQLDDSKLDAEAIKKIEEHQKAETARKAAEEAAKAEEVIKPISAIDAASAIYADDAE